MRDRIAIAYMTAMKAAHASKSVRIHLGREVWDYLHSQATITDSRCTENRLFGFPVHLEEGWPADQIVVRTDELIFG